MAQINATAVWRCRAGGNDNNGAGYDAGISGAGTDYSQQDSAQASWTGLTTSGAGSTTLTDGAATGLFTSAMVGNAIYLASGTNFTAGYYFVTAFTNSNNVTVSASPTPSAAGSAGVGSLGGAARQPFTRLFSGSAAAGSKAVAGNIIFLRNSTGTEPTNGSTADYSTAVQNLTTPSGNTTDGYIRIVGENGRAKVDFSGGGWTTTSSCWYENLYLRMASNTSGGGNGIIGSGGTFIRVKNCVFDTNGLNTAGPGLNVPAGSVVTDSEFWSGSGTPAGNANGLTISANASCEVLSCFIHDNGSHGVSTDGNAGFRLEGCIIAGNGGDGIHFATNTPNTSQTARIANNTIDGNSGNGITFGAAAQLLFPTYNNIISNHTGVGKSGISAAGTLANNDRIKLFCDYNDLFNNTTNYSGISAGPNDMSVDPQYTSAATGDYTIGTNLKAKGYPSNVPFIDHVSGGATPTSFMDIGALQRAEAGGSTTIVVNAIRNLRMVR